jgi:peptide/nickel transport system permease protein
MRVLTGVPVFFLVTLGATALSDLMPGSAALTILGDSATPDQIAALTAQYGYDRPLYERYFDWLGKLLHGDLGQTLFGQQPVFGVLIDRAAVTFELAFLALGSALIIAIPVALFVAMRPGGAVDGLLRALSSVILSVPSFVVVVLFGFVFSIVLRWLPATGWVAPTDSITDNLRYAALPVLCLGIYEMAFFYRLARSEFIATLQEDYILVARAKGLPTSYILLRHVLRPSLTSLLTFFGLSIGRLLGGSFIVENYFAVPGIGWTAIQSAAIKDIPMLQGIVSLAVVVYILVFILVDFGYAIIDPRVSVS